ncbi:unnamed protein product [Closterium sp. NIES-54]
MNDDRRPPALAEAGVSLRGEYAADGGSRVPLTPAESADAASPLHETVDLSARIPTRGAMTAAEAATSAQCTGGAGSTPTIANRNAAAGNAAALLISSSPSRHGFLRPTPGLDRATFPLRMLGSATAMPVDHNRGVAASYSSIGDVVPSPATAAAARDSVLAASGTAAAAALPLAPFASAMDALRATSHRTWEAAAAEARSAADLTSAAEDRSAQQSGLDGGSSSVALLDLAMQAAMQPVFSGAQRPLFLSPFRAPTSMLPMTFSIASNIDASASAASADAATPAPGPPHLPFPPQISRLSAESCASPPQFSADPRLFLTRLTQLQAAGTVGAAAGSAFAASTSAGEPGGAVAAHAAAAAVAEGELRTASLMDEGKREEGGGVVAVRSEGEWGEGHDCDGRGGGDQGGKDDEYTMMKAESDADVASGDNSGGGCSEDEENDGHGGDEGHGGQQGLERHAGHGGHGEHGGNGRGHGGHEEKAGEEVKGQLQQSRQARQTQNQRGPQMLSRGSTRAASGPHQTRYVGGVRILKGRKGNG